MKIRLFTIALAFTGLNSLAQITVADTDIIDVGDNIYEAEDAVSASAIQIGASGANQNWDFSNLQEDNLKIIQHVSPSSSAFGFMHPTSNICAIDDNENVYMNKSLTGVEIVGFDDVQLLNPILVLPLPLTYPMQHSTGAILALDDVFENSFIDDSLAMLITFGAAHTIDSIKLQVTLESFYNVDGWGNVIMPMGTFAALRLYVSATNTQTYSIYCTDTTMQGGSGWYPAPQQLLPTGTENDYFYQWWSNDPAVKFALVNIDVDEYGDNDGGIQFLTTNLTSIEEENDLQISVFPVPATYSLTIESKSSNLIDLTLLDVMGRLVFLDKFTGTTQIDLMQMSKGVYYLNLKTTEGELTKKIIIE